jgi:hypothetical protein
MSSGNILDACKKVLLNSTLLISKPIYHCFHTAFERGSVLSKQVVLNDYNDQCMGYGFRALEPIPMNNEILRVPLSSGLNGIDMVDMVEDTRKKIVKQLCTKIAAHFAPEGVKRDKMYQIQTLTWQVILNNHYLEAANNSLVAAFPHEDLTQTIYFPKEIIDNASSLNVKIYISYSSYFYKTLFDYVKNENFFEIDINHFLWAYNNVLSRKLSVETRQNVELLLPIIDYVNHSSIDPNVIVMPHFDINEKKSYLVLQSTRNIEAGEQLLRFYGEDNNRNYMNKYGFFDKENKIKELALFYDQNVLGLISHEAIVQEYFSYTRQAKSQKAKLFETNKIELGVSESILIYPNKFENMILKYLRINFLNEAECIKASGHDFSKIFSIENEIKVYKFLKVIFDKHFSFINYNNYTAKIEQIGKIDNIDKYKLLNLYLLEEEEQFLLSKNIDYLNKKLNTLI